MVNTENVVIEEAKEAFENLSETQLEKVEEIVNDPKLSIWGKVVAVFAILGIACTGVFTVIGGYKLIKKIKELIEKKKAKKLECAEEPAYREINEEETEEPVETTEE